MFSKKSSTVNPIMQTTSNNIIGQECLIEGNITTSGNLRIEGQIIGKIQSKAKVVLGQTAQVQGHIFANHAEISGQIKGNIKTEKLLILKATAIMEGDIVSPKLIFEEGACFDGKCSMGKPQVEEQTQVQPITNAPKLTNYKNLTKQP